MKIKKFICGITFFTTPCTYKKLRRISDEQEVSISELLRDLIGQHLDGDPDSEPAEVEDIKD